MYDHVISERLLLRRLVRRRQEQTEVRQSLAFAYDRSGSCSRLVCGRRRQLVDDKPLSIVPLFVFDTARCCQLVPIQRLAIQLGLLYTVLRLFAYYADIGIL